ncbi:MAG: TolC family protein [Burkholderiaceae bacterium]|nr:TolC family protein [Burkholderiaceae bacterium]
MHPRTRTAACLLQALPAVAMAAILATAPAGVAAQGSNGLRQLFDAAWARQPEAQTLQARREAAQAQRRAADAWTPEPPSLEASHKTDRLHGNDGVREVEIGIALPLWLPGERLGSHALAQAEAAAVESRAAAARLRLAAAVREAWWAWQLRAVEVEIARSQLDGARRLAADVSRRVQAGELARADRHQADGAVATAEAGLAQAEAGLTVAWLQLGAMAADGAARAGPAPAAPALAEPEPEPSAAQLTDPAAAHPALVEGQDRSVLAERAAALAALQSRANPELMLATTRDRAAAGERYGQSVTLALRIPLGAGPRHEGRLAAARADAAEAQAQLALDRARLRAEREASLARVAALRSQLAAALRRADLARETRGFFEKSFRLGETDLPTRLRVENDAAEAERQAARSRVELAAAISAWRQALGLLPQ